MTPWASSNRIFSTLMASGASLRIREHERMRNIGHGRPALTAAREMADISVADKRECRPDTALMPPTH